MTNLLAGLIAVVFMGLLILPAFVPPKVGAVMAIAALVILGIASWEAP